MSNVGVSLWPITAVNVWLSLDKMAENRLHSLLDKVAEWIEEKGCAYLAKENKVVYFASPTGRKQDFQWITMNLSEMVRVIKATRLTPGHYPLSQDICIRVFQEQARVYEFGVRSRAKTEPHIFNYSDEADYNMSEEVAELVAQTLYTEGYKALFVQEVANVYNRVLGYLKEPVVSPVVRNELFRKHFERMGYDYRIGAHRVFVEGTKVQAIIASGAKPKDLIHIDASQEATLVSRITGQLK